MTSARKRMKRSSLPAEATSSTSFTLRRQWFHFHGVAAAAREAMAAQIQDCDGELWPPDDAAVLDTIAQVFVVTDYWADWLPTQQSLRYKRKQAEASSAVAVDAVPMVPIVIVTPFWLHEVLRCEELLPPDAHLLFTPPPVSSPSLSHRRWIQYPMHYVDTFGSQPNGDHRMRLPCSPQNAWKQQVPLWPYYVAYLHLPMTNTRELACVLNRITGQDQRRLTNLETAIEELLTRQEREQFFQHLLPKMVELVLDLPSIFPESPLLLTPLPLNANSRRTSATQEFSKLEVLALVSACFFSIFPAQDERKKQRKGSTHPPPRNPVEFPFFSMNSLFASARTSAVADSKTQKLRCVLQYFLRVVPLAIHTPEQLTSQVITFTRVAVHPPDNDRELRPQEILNALKSMDTPLALTDVRCESNRWIEALDDHLQIDFANQYAGGGVFSGGCVQEEIRFVLSPELFVACLVFAKLEPHEAFVIHGTGRYSQYNGYGLSFTFSGDFQDATSTETITVPGDDGRQTKQRRQCVISGIDAFDYGNRSAGAQYTRPHIWRDLVKALAGFVYPETSTAAWPIATGNWGCGVFRGDPELKFLIQWLAASLSNRDLVYVLFERDQDLHSKIETIVREFNEFNHPDARTLFQSWIAEFLFDTMETITSNLRRAGTSRGFSILAIATAFVQRKKRMNPSVSPPPQVQATGHLPADVEDDGDDGDTVMTPAPEPHRQPKQLQQTRMDSFFTVKSNSK